MNNAITKRGYNPSYINDFSNALLSGFYLKEGENFDDALARAAEAFCFGDYGLAQRIYEYAHDGFFMFASPILSNSPIGSWTGLPTEEEWKKATNRELSLVDKYWDGTHERGMPISCFSIYTPDTIDGQIDAAGELAALSVAGGGVGIHNGIRAATDKAPGPIPYMKTIDANIGYYRQGKSRRGACAWYMDISHPDIMEHIKFRNPSGGDSARKSDNRKQFHCAVNVTDEFIAAVMNNDDFDLVCPHSGKIYETVKARELWEEVLEARALTGEPYIFKIDTANRDMPQVQKDAGLRINGSNICSEITLPTSEDRTFVCCLSSLNLETHDQWKDSSVVADLTRFLDNVIQYFIEKADGKLGKAVFSATQERAIGIGTMGWHYYLMSKDTKFEGGGFGSGINYTHIIYGDIKKKAVAETIQLAKERGEPGDLIGTDRRNSNLLALAPNSNNSIIMGTSPSIEPISGNCYTQTTRAGAFLVKNPYLNKVLREHNPDEAWIEEIWTVILANGGSVQTLDFLTDHQKDVFKTGFEIDQHWIIEQANERQKYVCQAQSLNLFFPAGVDRAYYNSVHLKALNASHLKALYYSRMERGLNADIVKKIERKALVDWSQSNEDDCVACSG